MDREKLKNLIEAKFPGVYDKPIVGQHRKTLMEATIDDISNMNAEIQRRTLKFLETGKVEDVEVEGYTIKQLTDKGMNTLVAFLNQDLLVKEPELTKKMLKRGWDRIEFPKSLNDLVQPQAPEGWYHLAVNVYNLIRHDIETVKDENLPVAYPKFIVMYEFFRLVRGEAFNESRPAGAAEFQGKLYAMEDDLAKRCAALEAKLDPHDSKTKFYLDGVKKSFDLHYFKNETTVVYKKKE